MTYVLTNTQQKCMSLSQLILFISVIMIIYSAGTYIEKKEKYELFHMKMIPANFTVIEFHVASYTHNTHNTPSKEMYTPVINMILTNIPNKTCIPLFLDNISSENKT